MRRIGARLIGDPTAAVNETIGVSGDLRALKESLPKPLHLT
jgi:hypothetical protein